MISRRAFLKTTGTVTGISATFGLPSWMPRLAFAQPYNNPKGDVLVSIFLRGGADALNMVVPHAEDAYYTARPQLSIPRPDASDDAKTLDLDGFFGLHPALASLHQIMQDGRMLAVHATGSPHDSRSHFEAMDYMERGSQGFDVSTGWIGRHLASTATDMDSPIRGIGWGTAIQRALTGAPSTIAMQSIIDYHLGGDEQAALQMMNSLMSLYQIDGSLGDTAQSTQDAVNVVQAVGYENYVPQYGAEYPENDFAFGLRQTAALIRADVGLESACIDLGGWDTHVNQGGTNGTQANLMQTLADGLLAFHQDMGPDMNRVTVIVMSEFGRRLAENGGRGTDHGAGGALFVMSDNLIQQPVITDWPTLAPDKLDQGDLAITIDYRDVLSELLDKRLKNSALNEVFPNFTPTPRGIFV